MPFASLIAIVLCLDPPYSAAADRARFPPSAITLDWHKFNEARICYLKEQIAAGSVSSMRPAVRDGLVEQLREAEHVQRVLMLITRFPYEPPESEAYWTTWMPQARAAMGEAWYARGFLPWGGVCYPPPE